MSCCGRPTLVGSGDNIPKSGMAAAAHARFGKPYPTPELRLRLSRANEHAPMLARQQSKTDIPRPRERWTLGVIRPRADEAKLVS